MPSPRRISPRMQGKLMPENQANEPTPSSCRQCNRAIGKAHPKLQQRWSRVNSSRTVRTSNIPVAKDVPE